MKKFKRNLVVLGLVLVLVFSIVGTGFAGVLMQGFYWDAPQHGEAGVGDYANYTWYDYLASKAGELSQVGFSAIWFPPPSKGASGGYSVGYDVYDHYDLGNYHQQGTRKTRYGSKQELKNAIRTYHDHGMQVYADTVLNHMSGGGGYSGKEYNYVHGKFEKGPQHFHPNHTHNDNYPPFHNEKFGHDICYYNDYNYMGDGLKEWSAWLKYNVWFDGYRVDFVKGISYDYMASWNYTEPMKSSFVVGEYYDGDRNKINDWINKTGAHAFDFPLHFTLKEMCNSSGYFDMRKLSNAGLIGINSHKAVTFVSNHDTDKDHPIRNNKLLAYAYILTHEGYPTVFWKDYYIYGMKDAIRNLVWIHEHLASGSTNVLHADNDLYVARRNGYPGLIVGINDSNSWKSKWVQTNWRNTHIHDYTGGLDDMYVGNDGRVKISVPPRGYTILAPSGH